MNSSNGKKAENKAFGSGGVGASATCAADLLDDAQTSQALGCYLQLLEQLQDPLVLCSEAGIVRYVNPAFVRLFGHAPEDIAGNSLDQAINKDGGEDGEADQEALGGDVVERLAVRYTAWGEAIPVRMRVCAVALPDGSRALIHVYRDETGRLEASKALAEADRKYTDLFENAVEGIFMTSPAGQYLDANPALARIYGYESPEELREHFQNISSQLYVDPTRRDEYMRIMAEHGEVWYFESEIRRKDGAVIWISENSRAVTGAEGEILHYEGTVTDITERKRAEEELDRQRAYFQQLFESSPQAIVHIDTKGRIEDVNPGFEALFGYSDQEVRGLFNRHVVVPPDRKSESMAFTTSILKGQPVQAETVRMRKDGQPVPVSVTGYPIEHNGKIRGAYYIYADITERKEFEEQLAHQAFHDDLTGLPNRLLFTERLGRALHRAQRRDDYRFAVFMIDLNRFKVINDSLGHHAGDQLLVGAARRMVKCVRSVDTVARLGGDEFAILLEEYLSPRDVTRVAQRIHEAMEVPFTIEDNEIVSSASIGIVLKTTGYSRGEDILRDADVAMYRAKAMGKAAYRVFNKKMHEEATRNLEIENELRQAIEQDLLVLHYQPIVSVVTQKIEGFEALVRWDHPRRGLVPPGHFIPVAEETGLIVPLGEWVLRNACNCMAAWRKKLKSAKDLSISVNLASKQLEQKDLIDMVTSTLNQSGLPPHLLKLELTETTLISNTRTCKDNLLALKELGVRLVVDDFGTGYSSLQYLQRMPIDVLKIDRSFICGGASDCEENQEIVKTILALARNLGMSVVAEGVEEEEQLARLAAERCDQAQGFMFSRPVDAAAAERLMQRKG